MKRDWMMNAEVSDGSIVLSQSADWRQQKIDQQVKIIQKLLKYEIVKLNLTCDM